jgi:hypothetical protein
MRTWRSLSEEGLAVLDPGPLSLASVLNLSDGPVTRSSASQLVHAALVVHWYGVERAPTLKRAEEVRLVCCFFTSCWFKAPRRPNGADTHRTLSPPTRPQKRRRRTACTRRRTDSAVARPEAA